MQSRCIDHKARSWNILRRSSGHLHTREGITENDLDPDDGNQRLCRACALPIFSTPYVQEDDTHLLHKSCANLPAELREHPLHHLRPLILLKVYDFILDCFNCYKESRAGFCYQCPDGDCRFTLCVLCGVSTRIVHRCHPNELTLFRNRRDTNWFRCGACGLGGNGDEWYGCECCGFFIHLSCASLPNTILHSHHDIKHPLCLTYAIPWESLRFQKCEACSICNEPYSISNGGVYFCTICDYSIHIRCATLRHSTIQSSRDATSGLIHLLMSNELSIGDTKLGLTDWLNLNERTGFQPIPSRDAVSGLIHLPMPDERTSFLARLVDINTEQGEEQKMHGHDVVLHHDYNHGGHEDEASRNLCNVCIRPISPPFYTCPQCPHFYLHRYCANLLSTSQLHPQHSNSCPNVLPPPFQSHSANQPLHLTQLELSDGFFSKSKCQGCETRCDGSIVYKCEKCNYMLDVECSQLPEAITHEMHGKSHVLFLSSDPLDDYKTSCHCCGLPIRKKLFYECCSCPNFVLDARCALLPSTVTHKYDRHPLTVTSLEFISPREEDYCEICEEGLDLTSWFYHCKECTTFFHITCIPFASPLSKIKFGETIGVRYHKSCPLTCIQLLTSYTYTCCRCEKTILGRQREVAWWWDEGIAFECTKCGYWLCYSCAQEECISSSSSVL